MSKTPYILTYTVAAPTAPQWFTDLPYLTWHPVAAGTDSRFTGLNARYLGARISQVVEPGPYQDNRSMADIVRAGNGAAIDQVAREVMLICCGGHSGRTEDSSFGIQMFVDTPAYRRLTDTTPYADLNWHFDQGNLPSSSQMVWRDAWTANTVYTGFATPSTANKVDVVRLGNELYQCTSSHTSGTTFDPTKWFLAVPDAEAYQYWGRIQVLSPGNNVPASFSRDAWIGPDGVTSYDIRDWPCCSGSGAITDPASNKSRQRWMPWTVGANLNLIQDRPRSMHTCYTQWYANGKVWFPVQNSIDAGTGPTMNIVMSFDANVVRAGTVPRPHVPGKDGIWTYYQPITELGRTNNLFGSTAIDPSTQRIWHHAGNEAQFFVVNTGAPYTPGTYTRYADPNPPLSHTQNAGSAISKGTPGRLWVVLSAGDTPVLNSMRVYDIASIEAGGASSANCKNIPAVTSIAQYPNGTPRSWNFYHTSTNDYKKGWGMVWYPQDKSFLCYSCDDMNRPHPTTGVAQRSGWLRRLKPPLNPDGTYDAPTDAEIAAGTHGWVCDEIAINDGQNGASGYLPDVVATTGTAIAGGSFTRFNIIEDMGNGESCLISQGAWDTPLYVCRLPNSALTGAPNT